MTSQWARWRLKSPASRLFTQPFIQTQIKENIKAPRHLPLPAQMASNAENVSIWWRHHGNCYCRDFWRLSSITSGSVQLPESLYNPRVDRVIRRNDFYSEIPVIAMIFVVNNLNNGRQYVSSRVNLQPTSPHRRVMEYF